MGSGLVPHRGGLGAADSLELAEDVGVLCRDAGGLEDRHPEGEGAPHLQVAQGLLLGQLQGVQARTQPQPQTLQGAEGGLWGSYVQTHIDGFTYWYTDMHVKIDKSRVVAMYKG